MKQWATLLVLVLAAVTGAGCGTDDQAEGNAPPAATNAPAPKDNHEGPAAATHEEKGQVAHSEAGDHAAHAESERVELTPAEMKAAGVRTAALQPSDVAEEIAVTATVQANQKRLAHVAPKVTGRIARVEVKLGDRVRRGQTLALIDSIEVGEAQASYLEAQTELELARAEYERAQQLFDEQIIPQKDLLKARADFEKARASQRAASDRLRLLGVARPAASGQTFSVYPITAPFAGTVIEMRETVVGELAKPDESLFAVADLSTMWVEASIPESSLTTVQPGAAAAIEVAAYPGERFAGKVTYVSNTVDKETRTVQARIEVPNPDGRLKIEMFATAHIATTGSTQQALVVPQQAVVLLEGKPVVFVQDEGAFVPRSVELGEPVGAGTVVRAGIAPGEPVVVEGTYALKARLLKGQMGEGHAH